MFLKLFNKTFLIKSKTNQRLNVYKTIRRYNSSTIYSLSTDVKRSGSAIAIVRISGPKALDSLPHLIQSRSTITKMISSPRKAFFTKLYDIKCNELIDSSVVICFKKPFSYTGEDMCELHTHGSNAVIAAVLKTLGRIDGLRPAQRGEFTKRALMNDKMDLIEVEAIHDLIRAQTHSQRRRALSAFHGSVTQVYHNYRNEMIELMANIEVLIDFGEEELIDESLFETLKTRINDLKFKIETHLQNCENKSQLIKEGLKVAIIGESNVGKSTLINKLCERDLSIVSPISGTTRDVIETWLDINGYSVSISDTAGIKDLNFNLNDSIEREGIIRAIKRAKSSDLILFVIDATALINSNFSSDILEPIYLKEVMTCSKKLVYLVNKIDLLSNQNYNYLQQNCDKLLSDYNLISCHTFMGFQQFIKKFTQNVEQLCGNPRTEMLFSTSRHEAHLRKVVDQMEQSMESVDKDIAVSAHHLREAAKQISFITGRITTEEVLDVIFRQFCIGK